MLRSDLPTLGAIRTIIPITVSWGDELVTTERNAPAEGWTTSVVRRWRESSEVSVVTIEESDPIELPLGLPHPEQSTVGAHAHAVEYIGAMARIDKE